jgi:hypothetical protein
VGLITTISESTYIGNVNIMLDLLLGPRLEDNHHTDTVTDTGIHTARKPTIS